ncbi:MAG: tRNA (adenosine(37)-N6)-threonylcarbamoyltransferase complex ATPase subunit type 1 TsaE [Terriglobales bacterium]
MAAIESQTFTSAEALVARGRELARELPAFSVLVLVGDLGAGKTTLMKGVAEGWDVARAEEVTSPTYTLIHEYRRGHRSLYHVDLYRIETGAQRATLPLDDLLRPPASGEHKLVAIEWGERIEAELPRPYLRLELDAPDPDRRCLRLVWRG